MEHFAVIRVDADFDYIEGVECVSVFTTEQEANECLEKMKKERDDSWKNRMEYIEKFVDNIEIPETDYQGWIKFKEKYFGSASRYVFPKNFKTELKIYLNNYSPKLEGFDPPQAINNWNNLFVIPIRLN